MVTLTCGATLRWFTLNPPQAKSPQDPLWMWDTPHHMLWYGNTYLWCNIEVVHTESSPGKAPRSTVNVRHTIHPHMITLTCCATSRCFTLKPLQAKPHIPTANVRNTIHPDMETLTFGTTSRRFTLKTPQAKPHRPTANETHHTPWYGNTNLRCNIKVVHTETSPGKTPQTHSKCETHHTCCAGVDIARRYHEHHLAEKCWKS